MILQYGAYAHDLNECMLRVSTQGIFDKFNRRMGDSVEWTILGVKQADTQEDLTDALTDLVTAYNFDYEDVTLFLADGTTPTHHAVLNDDTFGGVKVVVPPTFLNGPWTGRIEYLNRRTYYIVLRWELRNGTGLYSWKERLLIRGNGGSKWKWSPQEIGAPQNQTLQTVTTIQYIQEGEAVGRHAYPTAAPPLYPLIEHGEMRETSYESAQDIRYSDLLAAAEAEMYPLAWRYVMEAAVPETFTGFALPTL